jgi:hypothetical protein
MPQVTAHLTTFGENIALTDCLEWLCRLSIEEKFGKRTGELLSRVRRFINDSGLLPEGVLLDEVDDREVYFVNLSH